jgi:mRNA-degrading endonuclease YafQ of YafQ-DinJ toxin-antitoxin module
VYADASLRGVLLLLYHNIKAMEPTDVSVWDREIHWTGIWLCLVSKDCPFIYKQKGEQGYAMQTAPSHQDRQSEMMLVWTQEDLGERQSDRQRENDSETVIVVSTRDDLRQRQSDRQQDAQPPMATG